METFRLLKFILEIVNFEIIHFRKCELIFFVFISSRDKIYNGI